MTIQDFYHETLGKTYGNPPPVLKINQGDYQGQCVSYIRQYWAELYEVNLGAVGHAKDYWNNPIVQKHFDQVQDKQEGDVAVYNGSQGGGYGHIGIYYRGGLLSQNWCKPLKVSLDAFPTKGLLGYLRKKGDDMYEGHDARHWYIEYKAMEEQKNGFVKEVEAERRKSGMIQLALDKAKREADEDDSDHMRRIADALEKIASK